jgi:branched-chain amino acid transport system substrate-binding protein
MKFAKGIAALSLAAAAGAALGQAKEIRIAHVYDKTGPLEAYAKQTQAGLMMGLEYATGGKMEVLGRRIVVIEKDSQTKPDIGKAQLAAAYGDDKVDLAVGPTASNVALAMLPVAEEYRKILLVEPAVADQITGENWNRYIFRTGRSSSQDAIANAVALGKKDTVIATLAQDYAFGRDGVKAFREALAGSGAQIVHEEYAPIQTTDFTAPAERLFNALKDRKGRKLIFVIWAGQTPVGKLADLKPERYGIDIATGGNILPALAAYKAVPGMEGATYYYYEHPKNKVNDWLVAEHQKRFKSPPDFFTAGGMSAGIAIVEALKRADGTDTEKLVAAMEGLSFDTPKGRMTFRKDDHQAMQSMYHFKIRVDPSVAWAVPQLVREIKPEEMKVPVRVKR